MLSWECPTGNLSLCAAVLWGWEQGWGWGQGCSWGSVLQGQAGSGLSHQPSACLKGSGLISPPLICVTGFSFFFILLESGERRSASSSRDLALYHRNVLSTRCGAVPAAALQRLGAEPATAAAGLWQEGLSVSRARIQEQDSASLFWGSSGDAGGVKMQSPVPWLPPAARCDGDSTGPCSCRAPRLSAGC